MDDFINFESFEGKNPNVNNSNTNANSDMAAWNNIINGEPFNHLSAADQLDLFKMIGLNGGAETSTDAATGTVAGSGDASAGGYLYAEVAPDQQQPAANQELELPVDIGIPLNMNNTTGNGDVFSTNNATNEATNANVNSRSISISYNDGNKMNSNLSDFLNSQYFSPDAQSANLKLNNTHNNMLSPMAQPTYFTGNNANHNTNNAHLALSPSSYGESFDQYGSLSSPTAISLAHSNSNTGSLTPLVRSPSNQVHSLPKQPLSKDDKLKRRREFHNAVERRRRDHIKERIKDLSKMVPPMMLLYDENGKDAKPNKATILTKTVEYINALNKVIETQRQRRLDIIEKIKELQQMNPNEAFHKQNLQQDANFDINFGTFNDTVLNDGSMQ